MGRINRKRKLSPSGSKARIVEDENGGSYAEITDTMGNQSRVSLGAMRLLRGLMMTVLRPVAQTVKPPVERKLDFDFHIDIQASNDDVSDDEYMIPSGQITSLPKLEDLWSREYLRDGWMRSRVKDIPWLSPSEIVTIKQNQLRTTFLGLKFDISGASTSNSMSEKTFSEIVTPAKFPIQKLPNELIMNIIDKMPMRDALNTAQTCKQMNSFVECPEFWRHRLLKDLNCHSLCLNPDHGQCGSREVLKETYRLVSKSTDLFEDDDPDNHMGILV